MTVSWIEPLKWPHRGGSTDATAELNAARDAALKEIAA